MPTIADRIAQQVVKARIEGELEGLFHPDSYGYRLKKSAAQRTKGVPQGSVIGPVLMNLYMHHTFDAWMQREHPRNPFARYADDAVAHCRSEREAKAQLAAVAERLKECKLEMHPEKSGVVYCRDSNRRRQYPWIQFTFLGYTFRPRRVQGGPRKSWTGFLPAVSAAAIQRMKRQIREWQLLRQTSVSLNVLASRYNATLRGWLNYYGHFYKSAMRRVYDHFDQRLLCWARRKYPQTCATSASEPPLATEDGLPTTSVVRPWARFWRSCGADDGSRVNREIHARFCEGLWVKLPRSTLPDYVDGLRFGDNVVPLKRTA